VFARRVERRRKVGLFNDPVAAARQPLLFLSQHPNTLPRLTMRNCQRPSASHLAAQDNTGRHGPSPPTEPDRRQSERRKAIETHLEVAATAFKNYFVRLLAGVESLSRRRTGRCYGIELGHKGKIFRS